MVTTVLDTSHLAVGDRAQAWTETTRQALMATRLRFLDPDRINAWIRTVALGPAQLTVMSYTPLESQRTPRLIRQSDPEMYQVALTLAGQQSIEQGRTHATVCPGELLLYDSSRPFTAVAGPHLPGARAVLLQFPRCLLPLPDKVVAPMCATAIPGRAGVGRLLGQMLTGLVDVHSDLASGDRVRLGTTAVSLTADLLAHYTDRQCLLPPQSRQYALFERVSAYIATHLHDPCLTPGAIAAAHFISTRYLHRIFQQQGSTVGDAIRQQRLARCRRDLADPSQRGVPISAIGMRWGYPRPSDLTRAFRAAMGMTPSEYRAASQDQRSWPAGPR
ncbi:helix-turn-helix domain-containing protein [Streptomyces sp. TS71-3]|uniref:AraC-like ligand-binding domain-containing protein n=1 Tax=Streptomyces sp. TS71-3 TaxID=2733862 RepID=UPI001B01113A|nr:helix-turn-helix domain-containing protein [Streptomyces sp. TS71-3]GHJ41598.1 transcriptional regulator [Streptomyces sp. TS71-3]